MTASRSLWLLAGALAFGAACSQPPQRTEPATAGSSVPSKAGPAQTSAAAESPRLGTVALVRKIKDRGLTSENWKGVVGSLFTHEVDKDVIGVRYEVTVFFRDGTQEDVIVDRDPGVEPGDRVRVTGKRIEKLGR